MKFSTAAAVAATAGLAAASPVVTRVRAEDLEVSTLGGATFRVRTVYNRDYSPIGKGPRALGRVYQKYGVEMSGGLLDTLEEIAQKMAVKTHFSSPFRRRDADNTTVGAGKGEVAAHPERFDIEYLAPVQIGTPPQTLNLNFDTGSSDLWVFSSETPKAQQNGHKIYDINASTTSTKVQGATWSIRYGDGSSSAGNVYQDTVSVGGLEVKAQAVESATRVSGAFTEDAASSGLLGLGFDHINQVKPDKQKTFFSNAMASLAMPLFSANLKKGEAGNYNFGFIDQTEFHGDLHFVDVNATDGYWQFQTTAFTIGNTTEDALHEAIADTGTTLLMVPASITKAYYSQIPGSQDNWNVGGYIFPCNATLPDLTLHIGTYKAVVPGHFMNYAPVDTKSFENATVCFGGVQSSAGFPFAIYGDIFFKAQFTVFHGGDKKLGFAPKPPTV
ncbi:aspartic peptidase domain-containing protein [Cercophora newfieldiana]|uniref:Aspartic peptidase domain-containing protein n=1 Tax=Cercophora newfieldiana TaxID=92897 RepID=A0AA40CZW4_9PEZI|nr:aspartic peptidase domain-containing protein [Cercophora newfieldiana]